jgi:hypothetical protein
MTRGGDICIFDTPMNMRRTKLAAGFVMENTDDVVKAKRSNVSTDEEIRSRMM